jgi:hypothetical protein
MPTVLRYSASGNNTDSKLSTKQLLYSYFGGPSQNISAVSGGGQVSRSNKAFTFTSNRLKSF